MPKNYFQFKQFKIYQDKCTMKVCTDACLFGASVAEKVSGDRSRVTECLEIGTGTGLLSLMYTQKNPNTIVDAIEIEESAYEQAKENFAISKWKDQLRIFHIDAKYFVSLKKYDLIISNPPFYENELSSKEKNKNIAKHDEALTLKDLISIIKTHLSSTGYFAVLLPYHRIKHFEYLAEKNNFFLIDKLLIRQTPTHNFFRGIVSFSTSEASAITNELTIKSHEGNYTNEFIVLMKDYYLKL